MSVLLLLTLAADAAELPVALRPAIVDAGGEGGKNKGKKKKKKKAGWSSAPFVQPQIGAVMLAANGGGALAADLGFTGGAQYRWTGDPKLRGQSHVGLSGQLGAGVLGTDARVGTRLGPVVGALSPQLGLELFWNRAAWSGASLAASPGVAIPLALKVGKGDVRADFGVAPAWLSNTNRRTPSRATGLPGFAHEISYSAALEMKRDSLRLGLAYEAQVREVGTTHTLGLRVRRKLG